VLGGLVVLTRLAGGVAVGSKIRLVAHLKDSLTLKFGSLRGASGFGDHADHRYVNYLHFEGAYRAKISVKNEISA
jgi:hypothetical protein